MSYFRAIFPPYKTMEPETGMQIYSSLLLTKETTQIYCIISPLVWFQNGGKNCLLFSCAKCSVAVTGHEKSPHENTVIGALGPTYADTREWCPYEPIVLLLKA